MQETKQISTYRKALKDRILETAMQNFTHLGIKAVKMDDIANELGISKRTLYEIYENKEVLLYEVVKKYHQRQQAQVARYAEEGRNVMDIILFVYRNSTAEMRNTAPAFYEDLVKYPSVMSYLNKERENTRSQFMDFLRRGISEGYFRSDVNYDIIALLFDALSLYMREHNLYHQYSFEELLQNMQFVTLRGFCTQEGIKKLDQFISSQRATLP